MIYFTDKLGRTNPKYPIIDSQDVAGGLFTVDNVQELEMLKLEQFSKLKEGTQAYVVSLEMYYQWKKGKWTPLKLGNAGIPILTRQMAESAGESIKDYILIRDPEDFSQTIENNSYPTTYNGNILDILFSAVRSLQSEVARLKNSFKYGISSYTEDRTAMSTVFGDIIEPEQEPLWAVEEDDLSELPECTVYMDDRHILHGDVTADNTNEILTIVDARFIDPEKGFKAQKDPKCLLFITSTGQDIQFKLHGDDFLNIDLLTLGIPTIDLYNILIIVSKKTTKAYDDPTLYGQNFIWIQISDGKTNQILKSGYYNGTTLQNLIYPLSSSYYIQEVDFKNLILSKFNAYTKWQDFTYEVIPSAPSEEDYKLGAAHITIRSVSSQNVLDKISNQLLENELIWVEDAKSLCLKSKNKIYNIGKTNNNDDDMTTSELIAMLESLGIIVTSDNNEYDIELNNIAEIQFIHEATGKKFNISVDSEGNLRSTPEVENLLADRLKKVTLNDYKHRGFISNLRIAESKKDLNEKDAGLLSDRLKIGAVYAPQPNRTIYGCSHAYVELENTSDQDITLDGCYLHVAFPGELDTEVKTLALKGVIKAGGTFLIRGKQYAEFEDVNTVIQVKTFDQEWYSNKTLIDFQKSQLNFMLVYDIASPSKNTTFIQKSTSLSGGFDINAFYIDGIVVRDNTICSWFGDGVFTITDATTSRDYVLKNTFELDPAKQAFQSLHPKDSSRVRGANKNDFKPFYIDTPIISFPNSDPTYDVSLITPKASFELKNVSTDKTKLDINKPNMVYCSFGINMHTTRCFNWISVGSFDEYVWIRLRGSNDWSKFESYKTIENVIPETSITEMHRREFPNIELNNQVYARMQGRFPGDGSFYTAHKCIIDVGQPPTEKTVYEYVVGRALIDGTPDPEHTSSIQIFTLYPQTSMPRVYHITDQQGFYWMEYQTWAGAAKALAQKIQTDIVNDDIMPVIINTGDVTQNGTRVNEWLDYYLAGYDLFKQYEHMSVVGNNDLCNTDPSILGTGDDIGKSNGYYHHLFNCYEINTNHLIVNNKYVPSLYYFECKLSASKYVRFVNVNSELTFINCRDWFGLKIDDNQAYNIYTGWLTGNTTPISTQRYISDDENLDFVPIYDTLYTWLTASDRECVVSCHEIPFTVMTRQNLSVSTSTPGYTEESRSLDGNTKALVGSHLNQMTKVDTACPYWFSRLLEYSGVKICLGGHKHTYTCTYPVREFYFYTDSEGDKNSLVHGPMAMTSNLQKEFVNVDGDYIPITTWEYTKMSTHNLLQLHENAHIAATSTNQITNFPCFIPNDIKFHTSRLPIVKFEGKLLKIASAENYGDYSNADLSDSYLPIIGHSAMTNGVIYFMCQATGYKQTSNKELPGSAQAFSQLLPLTTYDASTNKDTASSEQQAPMFGILKWKGDMRELQLIRVANIQKKTKQPLYNNPGEYGVDPPSLEYINCESDEYIKARFGEWDSNEEHNILTYEA